jgi:hypothetical protein
MLYTCVKKNRDIRHRISSVIKDKVYYTERLMQRMTNSRMNFTNEQT